MRAVRAFHSPVEFRRARREDEEANALLLAGLFKGGKLTAPNDLNGPNGDGHPPLQGGEKVRSRHTGGAAIGLHPVPVGHDLAGRELLERDARPGPHIECIDLHEIARSGNAIVPGLRTA